MGRRGQTLISLALAVLIFVGINIFADNLLTAARLDLTENGSFTVSQGTKAIIAKLPEPVTLKFYYSKHAAAEFAATAAYAKRVRDLLGEYVSLSHGKIILQEIDPEPFTPEEDEASAAGLTAAPTQSGEQVYFGLVGSNSIDAKELIPYFTAEREPYLEYDLSSLLYRLSNPKKPVVALITALPLTQGQPPAILSALREEYQVNNLAADFTAIPAGTNLLFIAHPPALNPAQLSAVGDFMAKGGRALVLVDPMSEIAQASGGPATSDLGGLLARWGFGFDAGELVLDHDLAQRVAAGNDPRMPSMAYPLWVHLTGANFDRRDPITANLQSLNLASVGALSPTPAAGGKFEPLITSSDAAALVPRARIQANPDPAKLIAMVPPKGHKYTIAARVGAVVVIADSDLLDDRFWVRISNQLGQSIAQPFADNGGLVLNAVENLTGSGDLIALRTRTNTDRPFTVVRAMQADAEAKFRETAEALQARLTAAQQQVQQLSQGGPSSPNNKGGNAVSLTAAQQADITRLRQEMAQTRSQLREVQRNLRADIDALGSELAFLNIAAMPLLVMGFAIVLAIIRRRRAAAPSRVTR